MPAKPTGFCDPVFAVFIVLHGEMTEMPAKPTGFCDFLRRTIPRVEFELETEMPAKPTGFCDSSLILQW